MSDDEEFTDRVLGRVLAHLPAVPVPPGFEARLLAAYDAFQARRHAGFFGALRVAAEAVWPGAPLWAPLSAFACALVLGAGIGAAMPSAATQHTDFSLEKPATFTLALADQQ